MFIKGQCINRHIAAQTQWFSDAAIYVPAKTRNQQLLLRSPTVGVE